MISDLKKCDLDSMLSVHDFNKMYRDGGMAVGTEEFLGCQLTLLNEKRFETPDANIRVSESDLFFAVKLYALAFPDLDWQPLKMFDRPGCSDCDDFGICRLIS